MNDQQKSIEEILQRASETHHAVYHKEDGNDLDWATWYSNWLVSHSMFSETLGVLVVRSKLTAMLVNMDEKYREEERDEPWIAYYAKHIVEHTKKLT